MKQIIFFMRNPRVSSSDFLREIKQSTVKDTAHKRKGGKIKETIGKFKKSITIIIIGKAQEK